MFNQIKINRDLLAHVFPRLMPHVAFVFSYDCFLVLFTSTLIGPSNFFGFSGKKKKKKKNDTASGGIIGNELVNPYLWANRDRLGIEAGCNPCSH